MEGVVPGAASPQRIRIFCLRALWPLAGTKLNGVAVMSIARNVNSGVGTEFAGPRAGSLLEIDTWIPSEVKAITPLVERLMRFIEGLHCIMGEESAVELALREALNNALVHVRCRCKVGEGISLVVSDQGQGFDASSVPDPVAVENLLAQHGRGIHVMKLAMDEVSFEQRGAEVHMWKRPANDTKAKLNTSN